jgi:hypothetical protein
VYDETIYNSCARARFAGCTYLRHIILGLNTVYLVVTLALLKTRRLIMDLEIKPQSAFTAFRALLPSANYFVG